MATVLWMALLTLQAAAQVTDDRPGHVNPEDRPMDPGQPTFVPMVKVGKVLDGRDAIPYVELNDVWCYPKPQFADPRQQQLYNRLVMNVKKVLPIAKEVNHIIVETYEYLQTLPNKQARDAHLKFVEKSIKQEYTPRMKKLTYAQGKLLIKLVYRECGNSAYGTLQAILGPVRAGFWQAFAWTFGASLAKRYDPEGVDRVTERIVLQVEAGQL